MNYIKDHFFQDIETSVFGKVRSFKMHDLAEKSVAFKKSFFLCASLSTKRRIAIFN